MITSKARSTGSAKLGASRMMNWLILLTAALIVAGFPKSAQSQDLSTLPGQWVIFDSEDGLPDNTVFAVWRAPSGVVWAGTAAGLASFNGVDPWKAVISDTPALTGAIRAVWGRSDQDIWAAGDAGLAHFDGAAWRQIPAETLGLPPEPLGAIWGNDAGALWVGGQSGLAYFDGAAWRAFTPQNSPLPDGAVQALAGQRDGSFIWIGASAGLAGYEPQNDIWHKPDLKRLDLSQVEPSLQTQLKGDDLAGWSVESLWLADEVLWVGLWGGLLRYDLASGEGALMDGSQWDGPDMVSSIWSVDDELWLGIKQPDIMVADFDYMQILKLRSAGGLRHFDGHDWRNYSAENQLSSDRVHAIWVDEQGVFWFATGDGVARFDRERWRLYSNPSPIGRPIQLVRGDERENLWLSQADAIYNWDGQRWRRIAPPDWPQTLIQALWVEGPNDVWIGDTWHGAARWNGHRWTTASQAAGLAGDHVRAIWGDGAGSLWFGASQGLSHLDRETGQWETLTSANSDLPVDWVSALWGDEKTLWIGALGGDVARYEPAAGRWQIFQGVGLEGKTGPLDLIGDNVKALALDELGNLWLATQRGLAHYDRANDSWQHWRALDILPPYEEPYDIAVTADGSAWLSARSEGIYRYRPDSGAWERFAPDRLKEGSLPIWGDANGRIWFGKQRYDPQNDDWLTFSSADGLVSDDVRAVWDDGAGALWFATRLGVNRLSAGRWQTFTEANGLISTNTLLLTGDKDRHVWAATLNGVFRYSDGTWQQAFPWSGSGVLGRDLYAPGGGRVWVVEPGGTLHYFDGNDWQAVAVANGQVDGLIQTVVEGPQGELWVGTEKGLAYRPAGGAGWSLITAANGTLEPNINAIWGDGERYIWVATTHGLSRYEMTTGMWRHFTMADGLLDDQVTGVWGDKTGRVWAVQAQEIKVFDGNRWQALSHKGLPAGAVKDVWVDVTGKLWAATEAGPAYWDGVQWQPPPGGPDPGGEVRDLWAAEDGLWIVAEHAIKQFDGARWRTLTTIGGRPAGDFAYIWSDRKGTAWVGGRAGLARIDGDRWETFPPETSLGGVRDIWGRSAGDVWAATEKGAAHFDGGTWRLVYETGAAAVLTGDGQGGLWLGTSQGLVHFDGETWREVTDKKLPSPAFVTAIFQAGDGSTWVGSDQGLDRFGGPDSPMRFESAPPRALLVDRSDTLWFAGWDQVVNRFDQRLPGDSPFAGASFDLSTEFFKEDVRAIVEDTQGDIWFGTGEGLLRYRRRPPIASIEQVLLANGTPVLTDNRWVTLPYRPGQVTITLAVTDTGSHSGDLAFWYRLEGKDTVWKRWDSYPFDPPADKRRQILYDGLEAGKNYTFHFVVYNANNDSTGTQSWTLAVSETPLLVRLREHWAFPWAVLAVALLSVGATAELARRYYYTRQAYPYRDAVLTMRALAAERYQVTWQEGRAAPIVSQTQLDRDLIEPYLSRLSEGQTDELTLRQLGEHLFTALVGEGPRRKLQAMIPRGRRGWRLRLNLAEAPLDLWELPWELSYGGEQLGFLGQRSDTALVRYVEPAEGWQAPNLAYQKKLRVLIIMALPSHPNVSRLNLAEEKYVLERILTSLNQIETVAFLIGSQAALEIKQSMRDNQDLPIPQAAKVRLLVGPQAARALGVEATLDTDDTVTALNDVLTYEAGWDIIHISGHAGRELLPWGEPGEVSLWLENDQGKYRPLDKAGLQILLRNLTREQKIPKLVVLNACRTAETVGGLVDVFLDGGVSAVVGMQWPVNEDAAEAFVRGFYTTLVRHGQADYAVSVGRNAAAQKGVGRRDWAAPILVMQTKEGFIFKRT